VLIFLGLYREDIVDFVGIFAISCIKNHISGSENKKTKTFQDVFTSTSYNILLIFKKEAIKITKLCHLKIKKIVKIMTKV